MADPTTIDLTAAAKARIVGRPARGAVFPAHIEACLVGLEEVKAALQQLYLMLDIDESEGEQLDNIGRIVGQPRRIEQGVPRWFFGFDDQDHAYNFMDDNDPFVGGPFYSDGDQTADSASLDDAAYRKVIRARIVYNTTRAGLDVAMHECLLLALAELVSESCRVYDSGGMFIEIGIPSIPTDIEQALLLYARVLPIASGVGRAIITWDDTAPTFAFDDDVGPNGATFGDDGDPDVGGVFAEEI